MERKNKQPAKRKTLKRRVSAKVSRRTPKKTFSRLFDDALPLSLRWVGWHEPSTHAPTSPTHVPLQKKIERPSAHVLTLREQVPVAMPTFEEFEKNMQEALTSLKDDTPAHTLTEEQEEVVTLEALTTALTENTKDLTSQLSENDLTRTAPIRWHLPEFPTVSFKKPYARCHTHVCRMLPSPFARALAAFVLFAFASSVPLQVIQTASAREAPGIVLQAHTEGWSALTTGAKSLAGADAEDAARAFAKARQEFSRAQEEIERAASGASVLLALLPQKRQAIASAEALTETGKELAEAANWLTRGMESARETLDTRAGSRLRVFRSSAVIALQHLTRATKAVERIEKDALPDEAQEPMERLGQTLVPLTHTMEELMQLSDTFEDLLGTDGSRRYLVLFQNHTELRATGGFIGSFAELVVRNGEVSYEIPGGGSYDLQGQLQTRLAAPGPLQLINARWEFQDVNWFPDFPTTAKKALAFYESAGGPSLDGVIAVNAHVFPTLLSILGDIEMPQYGLTVDAENFLYETQRQVEVAYDKEANTPKQFLADLAPRFIEATEDASFDTSLELLRTLGNALVTKDVQIYLTDSALQEKIAAAGWSGALQQSTSDYVLVVTTNIGGGKTDAVIDEDVDVRSVMQEDGRVRNTVSITRTHTGVAGAPFTGANNVSFLRVYVPRGATLIGVEGGKPPLPSQFEKSPEEFSEDPELAFSISAAEEDPISGALAWEESDKTVFGHWLQVRPGTSATATFTYEVPAPVRRHSFFQKAGSLLGVNASVPHTLLVDSQSGSWRRHTSVSLIAPPERIIWSNGVQGHGTIETSVEGPERSYIGVVMTP